MLWRRSETGFHCNSPPARAHPRIDRVAISTTPCFTYCKEITPPLKINLLDTFLFLKLSKYIRNYVRSTGHFLRSCRNKNSRSYNQNFLFLNLPSHHYFFLSIYHPQGLRFEMPWKNGKEHDWLLIKEGWNSQSRSDKDVFKDENSKGRGW